MLVFLGGSNGAGGFSTSIHCLRFSSRVSTSRIDVRYSSSLRLSRGLSFLEIDFASPCTASRIDSFRENRSADFFRSAGATPTNSVSNSSWGPGIGGTRVPDRVHDIWQ